MAESDLSNEVNATTVLPAASNVSASTVSNGVEVTWQNNDDSPDGGIDVERSRFASPTDGFESGTLDSEWSNVDANFTIQDAPPDGTNSGDFAAGTWENGSPSSNIAAEWTPDPLASGKQPDQIRLWYSEGKSQSGCAFVLRNANGGWEVAAGSENPQPFVEDGDGNYDSLGGFDTGGYNNWTRITFDFDWSANEVSVEFYNPAKDSASSPSRSLNEGVDIATLQITETAPLGSGGSCSALSVDDLSVSQIQTDFADVATGLSPPTTAYTDTTTSSGTTYQYRVERNTDHATATSNSAEITTALSRSASSVGAVGASAGSRALSLSRASVSQGAVGASTSTRALSLSRTTASVGDPAASASARALAADRTAASTGQAGASEASRVADYARESTSQGAAGTSTSTRALTLTRASDSGGGAGASTVSREQTLGRSATSVGQPATSTVSRAYPDWALDPTDPTPPTMLPTTGETEATSQTLSLGLTVDRELADTLNALAQSGDIATSESFGGAFRAAVRDAGDARTLEPPGTYQPPFVTTEIVIAGYDESQVAPDRVEVSLELQRTSNRDTEFDPLTQTGAWELTLAESGTVGLDERQVGQLETSGTTSGRDVTLPLLVSDTQAAALLDSLGFPAGVVERQVPDGDNRVVDESGRQAIDITTPDGALIESGGWLCRDWSLSWYSHDESARWRVELTLAQPD